MLDETTVTSSEQEPAESTTDTGDTAAAAPRTRQRRRAASRPAGPPQAVAFDAPDTSESGASAAAAPPAKKTAKKAAKKTSKSAAAKKSSAKKSTALAADLEPAADHAPEAEIDISRDPAAGAASADQPDIAVKAGKAEKPKRKRGKKGVSADSVDAADDSADSPADAGGTGVALLFQAPEVVARPTRRSKAAPAAETDTPVADDSDKQSDAESEESGSGRRRRSRGGRNRRKSADAPGTDGDIEVDEAASGDSDGAPIDTDDAGDSSDSGGTSRRRRRRRRSGEDSDDTNDDPADTVVRVRRPRKSSESISSVEGSTRIEAKKQRRREGREAGRRRPPILSESEFLARRESVDRTMVIRQRGEVTQIAVLEDEILVEHYVALESQTSLIGNVYLGRVQNVLPSMEAAFIDIGRGRNAVLYAGEVDWDLVGEANQPRRIENALKPGQAVLVQVSKDPVGHKGARLTSQISLPGRYLVYVPGGGTSGISRKLPDTERTRLKTLLKDILPDTAGVIIRTAAEGASEDELTRDVTRLTARWEDIEKKVKSGQAPALLYAEPDTTLKVVRDLFTEDFAKLVIAGDDAWDMVEGYVQYVAPDLAERLERHTDDGDVFEKFRVDEQIAKALDRKVWLPSGGSLVIDRTEAMTVVDVNTGKFTGSGGNLEETVTKNNLEAAEEIVRQLRLRDIGGIIVIDFIDMVLEGNRDLVLRRLVECLGRDRTRHQVAEVTSLGLVQMTRKRIGTGLIEAFSHTCEHCQGRGVVIESDPIEPRQRDNGHAASDNGSSSARGSGRRSGRGRRGRRGGGGTDSSDDGAQSDGKSKGADTSADGANNKSRDADKAKEPATADA
ncbi:MAG TPA: Rne/Rng family ribonuclease [Nocardioidaceae bacterium]|nr:Rne/Rng family ribonuclease [Nocardioidaceae bacterium]